jgi:hypothetical protein
MTKLTHILHEIKSKPAFNFQIAANEDEERQFYDEANYESSGLSGYIKGLFSYNELVQKLGAEATVQEETSYQDGGPKVSAEWIIKTGNPPQIVRIYDYKGDVATPEERDEKIVWHVGGDKETSRKLLSDLGFNFTDDFREAYRPLGLYESLLVEYSEKVIKNKFDEYKNQVVNLDYDTVEYYVQRFDQIKDSLKQRVQRGDELVLRLLPRDLKTEDALNKFYYIDILRWKKFNDLERLIDGAFSKAQAKKKEEELVNSVQTDADLIYSKDGIEIYKGDAEHKCIKYGKDSYYSWCISQPQRSAYNTYRFRGAESRMFYFIFDRNKTDRRGERTRFEDPFHAFVIHVLENGTYKLTNAANDGDRSYRTFDDLVNALPEDIAKVIKANEKLFTYIPPSAAEIEDQALSGKELTPDQFAELTYATKQRYIQRNASNYRALPASMINLLDLDLKNLAINNDRRFTYDELKSNLGLVKRYADYRWTRFPNEPLPYKFLPFLKPEFQQEYYDKFEEDYLSFDEIEEYFSKDILKQYIQKQIDNFDFLPEEAIKYMTPDQKKIFDIYSKSFSDIEYRNDYTSSDQKDRIAPSRSVQIFPISLDSFKKLSDKERKEYIDFLNQNLTSRENQEKFLAVSYGVPATFVKDGKQYFITPESKNIQPTYAIIDTNGNVLKSKIKNFEFFKDGRKLPKIQSLGNASRGIESFDLKPGVDYDEIKIDGEGLNLQESKTFLKFKKLMSPK